MNIEEMLEDMRFLPINDSKRIQAQVLRHIERLEAELAELRKDKVRLDWLESKAVPWDAEWHFPAILWADYKMELRAAIDAAMESEVRNG